MPTITITVSVSYCGSYNYTNPGSWCVQKSTGEVMAYDVSGSEFGAPGTGGCSIVNIPVGTYTNGWSVTIDSLNNPSQITVTYPDETALGEYFLAVEGNPVHMGSIGAGEQYGGTFTVICTCTPIVTPSATNKTANGYTLNVKLDVGDCQSPLSDIVWDPAPSSGQGTTTAVYTNRSYGTVYSGSVTATDANDCEASADFSFQLKLEPNPKGCENAI